MFSLVNDGAEPYKTFSGKFNVRIAPELHIDVVAAAKSKEESRSGFLARAAMEKLAH